MGDQAKAPKSGKTLRTLFIGAALGAGTVMAVPPLAHEALVAYRNAGETREFRLTVTQAYPPRPGLPPRITTAVGMEFDIVDVPSRGVTNADAIWRDIRVGCTYNVAAFGLRSREMIKPVLSELVHFPTPQCPVLKQQ